MKIDELSLGDKVFDGWYPEWGLGEVVKLFKTTVHINFPKNDRGKCIYDKSHVRYLEREKDFFTDFYQDRKRHNETKQ